jgi:hypothetical protein
MGEREDEIEPLPNTAVDEPDQIVSSGRRAITSLPPSQPRASPDLPLAATPSSPARHHISASHAAVSLSLSISLALVVLFF